MSTLKVSATVHSEFTHYVVYFVMYKNRLYTIVSLSAAMIALFKDLTTTCLLPRIADVVLARVVSFPDLIWSVYHFQYIAY